MIRWYILLVVAVLFNGIANVLMKAGMRNAPEAAGAVSAIKHYLHSWPVLLGLTLFALNVVAYTQALTKIPLSVAYPLMVSLSGVIVVSSSMLFFKEDISTVQWLGFALLIAGIVCVAK